MIRNYLSYPYLARLRGELLAPWFRKCGKKNLIYKPLKISLRVIELGDYVFIYKNCRIEGVCCYENQMFNPVIVFGDRVSIQQNLHLTCAERVEIGANTAIAANVTITDIDHPYQNPDIPIERQCLKTSAVYIGPDCKIYNNAVIVQGTKIGKHCVVAANSVVSGNFPDYCVIAGAPARIVKQYNMMNGVWERLK